MGSKTNAHRRAETREPHPHSGELAALLVLHAVSKVIGAHGRRAMAKALLEAVDDWTRAPPSGDANAPPDPAAEALRHTAECFGRPAARMLLVEDAAAPIART